VCKNHQIRGQFLNLFYRLKIRRYKAKWLIIVCFLLLLLFDYNFLKINTKPIIIKSSKICTNLYKKYNIYPEVRSEDGWVRYFNNTNHLYIYSITRYDLKDLKILKKCLIN